MGFRTALIDVLRAELSEIILGVWDFANGLVARDIEVGTTSKKIYVDGDTLTLGDTGDTQVSQDFLSKTDGNSNVGGPSNQMGKGYFNEEINMSYLSIEDGLTAPSAATGKALIYVDSADGDLKVKFSDGVTKTIATDT